jgi:hypothetical protein
MNASVGGHAIAAFFQSVSPDHPEVHEPAWEGHILDWPAAHQAGFLRAIVKDYLADFSADQQWSEVAFQAAFMLAALYSDEVRTGARPAWTLTVGPLADEGFLVRLSQSRQGNVPPVPTVSGAGAMEIQLRRESVFTTSFARLAGALDLDTVADADLAQVLRSLSDQVSLTDARLVQLAGAMLALWKACQMTGPVTGGALFKAVRRPEVLETEAHTIRLRFERTGEAAETALEQAVDGGAILLS